MHALGRTNDPEGTTRLLARTLVLLHELTLDIVYNCHISSRYNIEGVIADSYIHYREYILYFIYYIESRL